VKRVAILCTAILAAALPSPAAAGEIFGGLYKHDVPTFLNLSGNVERGVDLQLGWRGDRIASTPLQPYVFGALNSAGDTSYAAVGLSARFGHRLFIRPGLGISVHTGSAKKFQDLNNDKIDFGSRVLFEPEIGVGFDVNDRVSLEASWVHMSHAQLFGRQNPGIDNIGARLTFRY
jgi:lipid A 3-O-deacylase